MTAIVDTHVHLYRTAQEGDRAKAGYEIWEYGEAGNPQFADFSGDPEEASRAMDGAGVSYAVVTNMLDEPGSYDDAGAELVAYNEWLCDLAERAPQFVACLGVDPGCLSVDDLVVHLRAMAPRNPAGIKLHPPVHRIDLSDESFWPVLETCEALGLRVVSHSGPSREGKQYGEPNAFRPILDAFPRLRLVLAHVGGAAWQQVPQLADDYPQVFFDCCEIIEWLGATRAPSQQQFVDLLRHIGSDRVMMGSDFPWYSMARSIELVRGLPGLTDDERDAVLGGNAVRFFDLSDRAPA